MNHDHAILLREITHNLNSAMASAGFGFVMAIATVLFLVWIGFSGFRSRWVLVSVLLFVGFFCACMSMWAQDLHFNFHIDKDAAKITAWSGIGIIALVVMGRIVGTIVERIPPTALGACFALLITCWLCAALVLLAPFKNLVLLAAIIGLVALVAIIAILAWVLDRAHERNVQHPRQVVINNTLPAQEPAQLLPSPPKRIEQYRGNLPAIRK